RAGPADRSTGIFRRCDLSAPALHADGWSCSREGLGHSRLFLAFPPLAWHKFGASGARAGEFRGFRGERHRTLRAAALTPVAICPVRAPIAAVARNTPHGERFGSHSIGT